MALSDPEHASYDPKAHLQTPVDQMDLNATILKSPLHNENNLHEPAPNNSTFINNSAHHANGTSDTHDLPSPIKNGSHTTQPSITDTQPSIEPTSSLPVSIDTAATHESLPSSLSQAVPDTFASKVNEPLLDFVPPLVQQPTSDVREGFQPQTQRPSSELVMEVQEQDEQILPTSGSAVAEGNPSNVSRPTDAPVEPTRAEGPDSVPLQDPHIERPILASPEHPPLASPPLDDPQDTPATVSQNDSSDPPIAGGAVEAPAEPAPSPIPPMESSAPLPQSEESIIDHVMQDAPASPPKVARSRDEDDLDAPAPKRTKVQEHAAEAEFKVPERPAADNQVNGPAAAVSESTPPLMTRPQQKHLQRIVSNVKRIAAAKAFLLPVDPIALRIPTYLEYVKQPMDLRTLEDNLRADKYSTVEACVADLNQIVKNAQIFNGLDHPVTKSALAMKASFDKHMEGLPSSDVKEATASKKKAADPMAIRPPPSRRESRSSLPGSARSPVSAGSPQAFALGPDGIPLIRRDSTVDGRPKREIHRPAPRDLPYNNSKPKKKKFQWELKFCEQVLKELAKPKYAQYNFPFMQPVDPVALNIPTYLSIVKKPMDFGTVKQKLDRGEYENAKEFEVDARQVFKNCYAFNPEGDTINNLGHKFESIFNEEWSKKRDWLDENTPSSGQRSPNSSEEEESEEEEEEEDEEDGKMEMVTKLQKQIAEMSKQVELITAGGKKNKTPPAAGKKGAKASKSMKKEIKKSAAPTPKIEKKAAPKPKKEKAPYVTYEQKQDISNRINSLTESKMSVALSIIRNNMPNLKGVQEDELELDIDELSNDVLYKLLVFVRKHAPRADDSPVRAPASSSTAAPARKKNKPMSKHEQEARIAQVQSGLSAFQKGGASSDSRVQQSIEQQESDDDDDDEEDSESEEE